MSLMDDWWENPNTYSQWSDPDGQLAERYHREHGRWPKGSRQYWEQQEREREQRRHPVDRTSHNFDPLASTLQLTVERLGGRLRLGAAMRESMRLTEEGRQQLVGHMTEDLIYALHAHVIKEDLPSRRFTESAIKTQEFVTVHIGPATWRDFWKLTHGHRWWVRWWVRRHPARVIDHPQTSRASFRATLCVDVNGSRVYPEADIRVREKLGNGYLRVVIQDARPMFWESADDFTTEMMR